MPSDWTQTLHRGVLRLVSSDGTAIIGIEALRGIRRVKPLLATAIVTLTKSYRNTRVLRSPGRTLVGLPALSAVVVGRNEKNMPIRVLVAGVHGHRYRYLLDVFTARNTPAQQLVKAQEILLALQLS